MLFINTKKIIPIFRVYVLGFIGVFSSFIFLLSFKTKHIFAYSGEIPDETLFSGIASFLIVGYFLIKKEIISREYVSLRESYLNWIEKQQNRKIKILFITLSVTFLVSFPLSLSISICQFALIEILIHFTNISIPSASDVTLCIVNIANFFIIRTYLFRYKSRNYFHQVAFYLLITALGLIVNYWVVEWIVSNFDWLNHITFGIVHFISGVIGYKSTPQLIASALLGGVWYKCHRVITFPDKSKRNVLINLLGFFN